MSVLVTQATHDLIWHRINWTRCHNTVRSLQRRIVKAIREGNHRKAKRLSYILTHSFAATVLAIRRVTENRGSITAGIEGQSWKTPKKKIEAIQSVSSWRGYRPYPLKRIYIPKKNGKKRPLGIPARVDRAKQALYLQALEPIAETMAELNSYGFRPKRQCADAIEQCFILLARKGWANSHRHAICNVAFPKIDSYVHQRLMRWAKRRHPTKTGCWIKKKYFCTHQGWDWTFYDKKTSQKLIHISQVIKPQKHVKIRADANPYDEQWADYFKTRDKNIKLKRMYGLRFKVYYKQKGICPCCKQPLHMKQAIELHHKNGNNRHHVIDNLVLLHLNCHRPVHHSGLHFQL